MVAVRTCHYGLQVAYVGVQNVHLHTDPRCNATLAILPLVQLSRRWRGTIAREDCTKHAPFNIFCLRCAPLGGVPPLM